jgi:hypothetical protein
VARWLSFSRTQSCAGSANDFADFGPACHARVIGEADLLWLPKYES